MKHYENGMRFKYYHEWETTNNKPYNYERYGLLKHLLSSRIINTENNILKYLINYY
jgi:hypothetical protein